MISVADYGAPPNAGHAVDAGINAAIDAAISMGVSDVIMPDGVYITSDTIHLGRGDTFRHVNLRGESIGAPYIGGGHTAGTLIRPTFSDRPVINIQGSRGGCVCGINIEGPNARPTGPIPISDPAAYAHLGTTGRHNSFCGIAIDAFSGSQPAGSYPFAATAWGKSHSSQVKIERCVLRNFPVGVSVKPSGGSGADQNGEFVALDWVTTEYCERGVAFNGSQTRQNTLLNCNIQDGRIAISGGVLGIAKTQNVIAERCTFDRIGLMAECPQFQWAGHWTFRNCYAERFGAICDMRSQGVNPIFRVTGCEFHFESDDSHVSKWWPAHIRNINATTRFDNCFAWISPSSALTRPVISLVAGSADRATFDNVYVYVTAQQTGRAEAIAKIKPIHASGLMRGTIDMRHSELDSLYSGVYAPLASTDLINLGQRSLISNPVISGNQVSGNTTWVVGQQLEAGDYAHVMSHHENMSVWLKCVSNTGAPGYQLLLEAVNYATDTEIVDETRWLNAISSVAPDPPIVEILHSAAPH